jgi:hypothetical protein
MPTLTKTQKTLIDRALQHGGAASVEAGGGRGALGGRMSFGSRERTALHQLVEMGLVRITHRDTDCDYNGGYGIRSTIWRYEIARATNT